MRPFLIGIAGPSGAGKSYLATRLAAALDGSVLTLDRYYRDLAHLPPAERAEANFDSPDALQHELLIEQIEQLRSGATVSLPVYDFAQHIRAQEVEAFAPADVVVIEGLFTFYWPQLRDLLDRKIYVDADDALCLARRKLRDAQERGRTAESVERQYRATVLPMATRYVRPTMLYADMVVAGDAAVEQVVSKVVASYKPRRG